MLNIPKNLWVLLTAQAFGSCGTIMVIFVGGVIGAVMAPSEDLATAPITAVILGVALSTVPAALLMRKTGRRAGFMLGTLFAIVGASAGAYAISIEDFWLFVAAMLPIGTNQAFIQQYRFAAIESVAQQDAPKAVSTVLLGSIGAALLGPTIGSRASDLIPGALYSGSYLALCGCYVVALLVLTQLHLHDQVVAPTTTAARRSLLTIMMLPRTLTAISGAAIGFGVMTLIMTATPLTMHVHRNFSMLDTGTVIQAHVMAMFLPSLFTGKLVQHFGETTMLYAGIVANFIAIAIALHGDTWTHFTLTSVALGLGWNLLFITSTTLLSKSYEAHERHAVQAANDFAVFSFQAAASLSAGIFISGIGWEYLIIVATVPLALLALLVTFAISSIGRNHTASRCNCTG